MRSILAEGERKLTLQSKKYRRASIRHVKRGVGKIKRIHARTTTPSQGRATPAIRAIRVAHHRRGVQNTERSQPMPAQRKWGDAQHTKEDKNLREYIDLMTLKKWFVNKRTQIQETSNIQRMRLSRLQGQREIEQQPTKATHPHKLSVPKRKHLTTDRRSAAEFFEMAKSKGTVAT